MQRFDLLARGVELPCKQLLGARELRGAHVEHLELGTREVTEVKADGWGADEAAEAADHQLGR